MEDDRFILGRSIFRFLFLVSGRVIVFNYEAFGLTCRSKMIRIFQSLSQGCTMWWSWLYGPGPCDQGWAKREGYIWKMEKGRGKTISILYMLGNFVLVYKRHHSLPQSPGVKTVQNCGTCQWSDLWYFYRIFTAQLWWQELPTFCGGAQYFVCVFFVSCVLCGFFWNGLNLTKETEYPPWN